MKPLTAKQRAEIYLELAEIFENMPLDVFGYLCWMLCDKMELPRVKGNAESIFYELGLFEDANRLWVFENHKERATCMLLCYEMTKD